MRYFILLLSLAFIGCEKDDAGTGEKTMLNIAYGSDPYQVMDIYLPPNRNTQTTNFMILVHGGAWSSGDKSDFDEYVDTLQRRLPSYAVFNLNYRLSTNGINVFPAQENDIKAAVEYILARREEFGISDKYALLGASAGAHLALLQGYKYSSTLAPKAIIDFFGPTDMVDLYNNPASPLIPPATVASIVGATPTSNPTLYFQSSPINFVTAQSPPTMILQGGLDPLVATSQSSALRDKIQTLGGVVAYVFYPNEGHSWIGPNLKDSFDKIQLFLTMHMN